MPPVIHVAGTNGKGSAIAFMRAMAAAAGLSVHVYTSPHLVRFTERIVVAGREMDDDALTALLEECEAANGGREITFFEITTVAAFLAFSRTKADILLLETGLGGRFDSTNVIDRPALTAITPISMDHTHFLGDTLPAIAGEKAGILKPGVPCVMGPQPPEAERAVLDRAREIGTTVLRYGADWSVAPVEHGIDFRDASGRIRLPFPMLPGRHQIDNAGLAAACLRVLPGVSIGRDAIARGLRSPRWPARLQRLQAGALAARLPAGWELWLDGGHNPAAGEALADFAARGDGGGDGGWRDRPLYAVIGMLNTRDPADFLAPLAPHLAALRAVDIPDTENTLSAAEAAEAARRLGVAAQPAPGVAEAIESLATMADKPARILICGSLYLAGHVLAENG